MNWPRTRPGDTPGPYFPALASACSALKGSVQRVPSSVSDQPRVKSGTCRTRGLQSLSEEIKMNESLRRAGQQ